MPTVTKGTTNYIDYVFIEDSASAIGAGLASLINTSITAYRVRPDLSSGAEVSMTVNAGTLGSWTSSDDTISFIAVDNTNCPGLYQVGFPNNILATGAEAAVVFIKDASGTDFAPVVVRFELVDSLTVDANGRVDVSKLNGSATPVTNMAASALAVVTGALSADTSGTTADTDIAYAATFDYAGRWIFMTSGGAAGTARKIESSTTDGGGSPKVRLTLASAFPAGEADSGDTFVIL